MTHPPFLMEDPSLKLLALRLVLNSLSNWSIEELLNHGLTAEQLDALHSLNAADLLRLAAGKDLRIYLNIDVASLSVGLMRLSANSANLRMQEYFIVHHASPAMLNDLFRLGYKEQDGARFALGVVKPRGRPPLPSREVRDEIHHAWHGADIKALSLVERYYELHQQFSSYTFAALYAVVNEFKEADR
jgi:hypothetical protein